MIIENMHRVVWWLHDEKFSRRWKFPTPVEKWICKLALFFRFFFGFLDFLNGMLWGCLIIYPPLHKKWSAQRLFNCIFLLIETSSPKKPFCYHHFLVVLMLFLFFLSLIPSIQSNCVHEVLLACARGAEPHPGLVRVYPPTRGSMWMPWSWCKLHASE